MMPRLILLMSCAIWMPAGVQAQPRPSATCTAEFVPLGASGYVPVRVVHEPTPAYPRIIRPKIDGWVQVRFAVCSDGTIDAASVRVVRSSDRRFEAQAVAAIVEVRFRAATMRGRPLAEENEQTVRFRPPAAEQRGRGGTIGEETDGAANAMRIKRSAR
ncbi:MAG: TonB family protein [Gemmatimonadales bacterium]